MKRAMCYFSLILSFFSCNPCKVSPAEEQKYLPFKYAVWSKVQDIDENGNKKTYNGLSELFVRQWYGWSLSTPQKGLDSVFIYRDNRLVFKDRVNASKSDCKEIHKVQLSFDSN
ncbi:MAG: hypothetical protein ACK4GN_00480 [Runella sp.]